jgi:hypothetical protein
MTTTVTSAQSSTTTTTTTTNAVAAFDATALEARYVTAMKDLRFDATSMLVVRALLVSFNH